MAAISDPAEAARFAAAVIRRYLPDPAYRIFLFGSRAAGSARKSSDIDIGIEGPGAVPSPALAAMQDELRRSADTLHNRYCRFHARPPEISRGRTAAHPTVTKTQSLRGDFARAVARLDEALALPKDPIVRDSAIQRFEISFELCGKFLKAYLEEQHNASCTSPRTCFRSAFRHGVIDNDPFWIDLTVLRNYTVHTYNEELAEHLYSRLAETARRFRALLAVPVDPSSS